jgi:hypothetical protein
MTLRLTLCLFLFPFHSLHLPKRSLLHNFLFLFFFLLVGTVLLTLTANNHGTCTLILHTHFDLFLECWSIFFFQPFAVD